MLVSFMFTCVPTGDGVQPSSSMVCCDVANRMQSSVASLECRALLGPIAHMSQRSLIKWLLTSAPAPIQPTAFCKLVVKGG